MKQLLPFTTPAYGEVDVVRREEIKRLSEYAKTDSRILDIGCGVGALMEYGEKYFSSALGAEPSKAEWEIANRAKRGKRLLEPGGGVIKPRHITIKVICLGYCYRIQPASGGVKNSAPAGFSLWHYGALAGVFAAHGTVYITSCCRWAADALIQKNLDIQRGREYNDENEYVKILIK